MKNYEEEKKIIAEIDNLLTKIDVCFINIEEDWTDPRADTEDGQKLTDEIRKLLLKLLLQGGIK